jgi:hypothetical protein
MKILQVATLTMLLGFAGTAVASSDNAAQNPQDQQQQEQQAQEDGAAKKPANPNQQ